jgi:hypothetical protein
MSFDQEMPSGELPTTAEQPELEKLRYVIPKALGVLALIPVTGYVLHEAAIHILGTPH